MEQEFIIGRNPSSPVKVPLDRDAVSGTHAKITITDTGTWQLEDLNSSNGTFVRDENGDFHRIYNKVIKEWDIIRLGNGGANSFVFTAGRVLHPDGSYASDFKRLKHLLKEQKAAETAKEKRIELNGWISKSAGVVIYICCVLFGKVLGLDIPPDARYLLIAFAPVLVGILFNGEAKSLKKLRKKRERILVCPKCNRPLSEYDIEQGQCSRCKAK